ncbi:holo-ACP synthase [Gardnerella greenwoodii]|uniref:Putative holo-[acyl-carrier protein] synthase n=1 Tax=Gardnerella greenwoodii 00703Dmash TaxID=698960 RepID=I4MBW9_9BIFI|nr:4'-phosphopantetheinyl transferase superfamily protein [Gardnerella greenwoodii]EIK86709.1 putative holo-[acyl-carrier protein] synthase [Gardnerella greenwoodii 00703Dmash]
MIAGLGHDVVNVAQFAEQMRDGDGWRKLFSVRELRQCSLLAESKHDDEALHIAARWAGKEAVIKAWCEALADCNTDYPYTLDNMPWPEIEILDDSHGCPRVELAQEVQNKLYESVSRLVSQKVSPKLSDLTNTTNLTELAELMETSKIAEEPQLTDLPDSHRDIRNAICWHISLTHDGSVQNNTAVASAVAILEIM